MSLRRTLAYLRGKREREHSIISLNRSQSALLGRELVVTFNEQTDIVRDDLVGIYRFLQDCYTAEGGCDHPVGICSCQRREVLEVIASKLGYDGLPTAEQAK